MKRVGTLLAATALAGCFSSRYQPRRPGYVSLVQHEGSLYYHRDGQYWHAGPFGGGLAAAVRGNAEAERAARTFQRRTGWGMFFGLGGLLCAELTWLYMAGERRDDPAYEPSDELAAASLGCAVVGIAGLWTAISAAPYQWDAINIYNDGVDVARAAPPLPGAKRPPLPAR